MEEEITGCLMVLGKDPLGVQGALRAVRTGTGAEPSTRSHLRTLRRTGEAERLEPRGTGPRANPDTAGALGEPGEGLPDGRVPRRAPGDARQRYWQPGPGSTARDSDPTGGVAGPGWGAACSPGRAGESTGTAPLGRSGAAPAGPPLPGVLPSAAGRCGAEVSGAAPAPCPQQPLAPVQEPAPPPGPAGETKPNEEPKGSRSAAERSAQAVFWAGLGRVVVDSGSIWPGDPHGPSRGHVPAPRAVELRDCPALRTRGVSGEALRRKGAPWILQTSDQSRVNDKSGVTGSPERLVSSYQYHLTIQRTSQKDRGFGRGYQLHALHSNRPQSPAGGDTREGLEKGSSPICQ
ncbi:collagen alpha-1(I) chain-like [Calypte anna]|uniref:collagen alpha-1(I) chain-like n=1 Tax=Calypte anna TaxID=9244 RepID=UPI0011C39518|nr:collagen alpha-1(I) chain-like [Calypte anna]